MLDSLKREFAAAGSADAGGTAFPGMVVEEVGGDDLTAQPAFQVLGKGWQAGNTGQDLFLPLAQTFLQTLVQDGLLGADQRGHATVLAVIEEAAYALLVLGGIEGAFAGEKVVSVQVLEHGLPPTGGAIFPPGQGDIVAARLEHGPNGREIAGNGLAAAVDIQDERPAAVYALDGCADDIVHLRGMEQSMPRRDGGGRIVGSKLAQSFLVQHIKSPLSHQADLLHACVLRLLGFGLRRRDRLFVCLALGRLTICGSGHIRF